MSELTDKHVVMLYRTWLIDTPYELEKELPENWDNMTHSSRETWLRYSAKPGEATFREVIAVVDESFKELESYVSE